MVHVFFYNHRMPQFGLDTFQVLKSHMWPVATVLDSAGNVTTAQVKTGDIPDADGTLGPSLHVPR